MLERLAKCLLFYMFLKLMIFSNNVHVYKLKPISVNAVSFGTKSNVYYIGIKHFLWAYFLKNIDTMSQHLTLIKKYGSRGKLR